MPDPRGIEDRLSWFLSHDPSGPGMCAQHTWHALGGDKGNPPAWGASDANECIAKIRASGRFETPATWSGPPPRGAWVGYEYGNHGHACLSNGDGSITTTDPADGSPTGVEDLDYPNRWGATGWDLWTDEYNNVVFEVAAPIDHGDVFLSKLHYGQQDSDSVRRLQMHLNAHPLAQGAPLPTTGNYGDQTDHEVRLCQTQHKYGDDPQGQSSVGPKQAAHLIQGCACVVHDDTTTEPTEPPPPDTGDPDAPSEIEYWYSGKPSGTLTFSDSYKKLDVPAWAPTLDGLTVAMIYLNVDGDGEFRVRLVRDPDDETAYQTFYPQGGDNFLATHVWFESGEGGRKLWWELQTMDGETMTVGTRYAKFACIPWG